MRVTILGSGTSTGVPVIGCQCVVCNSPEPRNKRTRASICIQTASGKTYIIDTGPDFRAQVLRENIQQLDAVLYTHTHADHCHGFDDVRAFNFRGKNSSTPVYLRREFADDLRVRFAYAFNETGYLGTKPQVTLLEIPADGSFTIGEDLFETISLPHGEAVTSAFRLGAFAYATDFKYFSRQQIEKWRGQIKVMVASGVHFRSHPSHSTIPETIQLFRELAVEEGIISHLSHEVEYQSAQEQLPPSVRLAYDGMRIDVK